MNSFIQTIADKLARDSNFRTQASSATLKGMIRDALANFDSYEDKNEFLDYYLRLMTIKIKQHRSSGCEYSNEPLKCMFEFTHDVATSIVTQEQQKIQKDQEVEKLQTFSTYIENIHVNQSSVLNFGQVMGGIHQNTQQLDQVGLHQVSEAIATMAKAIEESNDLTSPQKGEYLENLNLLSEQALKPENERLPRSTIKTVIQHGLGALNALSSLSTISGVTLQTLFNHFFKNSV